MKVIDALKQEKQTLSFEFFPPKTEKGEEKLFQVITDLKKFNPDFVSVTCGALGSARDKTTHWVKKIKEEFDLEPVAHVTCVAETAKRMKEHLQELEAIGIKNILALRGDPPEGQSKFVPSVNGFENATELVAFIKKELPDLCLGVAGYPEGHKESPGIKKDIEFLKKKVDAGADYIISQLFLKSDHYFQFLERCQKAKINVPILPGIMIITNLKQIEKMSEMCGATIPRDLFEKLEEHQDDPKAIVEIGIERTIYLCREIASAHPAGFHFFVMNQSGPIGRVLGEL
ncbi:methylenetetrahydrofolate reductase [NAD(P)H] [Candidatus Margulisiibacteriota bacterium]